MNPTSPQLIEKFVRYYLHWGEGQADTCNYLEYNSTQDTIETLMSRCISPTYTPPTISIDQITWKKSSKPKNDLNSTEIEQNSTDAVIPATSYEKKENMTEIIYGYLAFAMLLPDHPFSDKMYNSLKRLSPLYPEVTFVIANAYSFADMCSQYRVQSFPRILFFTKGMLKKSVDVTDTATVAVALTNWTNAFPKAFPAKAAPRSSTHNSWLSSEDTFSDPPGSVKTVLFDLPEAFGYNLQVHFPPGASWEPIMGSYEALVPFEMNGSLLILAALYVLVRLMFCWKQP